MSISALSVSHAASVPSLHCRAHASNVTCNTLPSTASQRVQQRGMKQVPMRTGTVSVHLAQQPKEAATLRFVPLPWECPQGQKKPRIGSGCRPASQDDPRESGAAPSGTLDNMLTSQTCHQPRASRAHPLPQQTRRMNHLAAKQSGTQTPLARIVPIAPEAAHSPRATVSPLLQAHAGDLGCCRLP